MFASVKVYICTRVPACVGEHVCVFAFVKVYICTLVPACAGPILMLSLPQLLSTIFTEEGSVSSACYHALDTLSLTFNSWNY